MKQELLFYTPDRLSFRCRKYGVRCISPIHYSKSSPGFEELYGRKSSHKTKTLFGPFRILLFPRRFIYTTFYAASDLDSVWHRMQCGMMFKYYPTWGIWIWSFNFKIVGGWFTHEVMYTTWWKYLSLPPLPKNGNLYITHQCQLLKQPKKSIVVMVKPYFLCAKILLSSVWD